MCKTSFLYYWWEREWSEWSETLKHRDGRNEKKRTIVNSSYCAFLWGYAYTCILGDVRLIFMLEHSFFCSNKCGANLSSLTITNTWIICSRKRVAKGKRKSRFHWVRFCDISDDAKLLHSNSHRQRTGTVTTDNHAYDIPYPPSSTSRYSTSWVDTVHSIYMYRFQDSYLYRIIILCWYWFSVQLWVQLRRGVVIDAVHAYITKKGVKRLCQ